MHQYNWDKSTKFWSVEKYNVYIKCDYKYLISVIFIRKQNYHNCIYYQVINRTVSIKENKSNYHYCIYYEVLTEQCPEKNILKAENDCYWRCQWRKVTIQTKLTMTLVPSTDVSHTSSSFRFFQTYEVKNHIDPHDNASFTLRKITLTSLYLQRMHTYILNSYL